MKAFLDRLDELLDRACPTWALIVGILIVAAAWEISARRVRRSR